ncbi:hypothetical protein, partial [Prevotella disiens]|uniref:hypothetical protein n=1 Tax=Prevotella disiens TaxID=28130 RepID=UPI001C706056
NCLSFVVCTTNIQSNYYRTNFFLADYEKHRGGLPCGRRREASEERHPTCLSVLAFANIVTLRKNMFLKYINQGNRIKMSIT